MSIVCKNCFENITDSEDLIICSQNGKIRTFHQQCYAQLIKSSTSLSLSKPINTLEGTIRACLMPIFYGIFLWLYSDTSVGIKIIVALIFSIPTVYRLFSYLTYERKFLE